MTSDVTFRRANTEDVVSFYGKLPEVRMKGYIAEKDGKPIMLGGVFYHKGGTVLFSELKPEARKCRKAIARGIRIVMDFADSLRVPIYAVPNAKEPTSVELLLHLGFRPTGVVTNEGEFFRKEPV